MIIWIASSPSKLSVDMVCACLPFALAQVGCPRWMPSSEALEGVGDGGAGGGRTGKGVGGRLGHCWAAASELGQSSLLAMRGGISPVSSIGLMVPHSPLWCPGAAELQRRQKYWGHRVCSWPWRPHSAHRGPRTLGNTLSSFGMVSRAHDAIVG